MVAFRLLPDLHQEHVRPFLDGAADQRRGIAPEARVEGQDDIGVDGALAIGECFPRARREGDVGPVDPAVEVVPLVLVLGHLVEAGH